MRNRINAEPPKCSCCVDPQGKAAAWGSHTRAVRPDCGATGGASSVPEFQPRTYIYVALSLTDCLLVLPVCINTSTVCWPASVLCCALRVQSLVVACRCSRSWWQNCLSASRFGFSACRSKLLLSVKLLSCSLCLHCLFSLFYVYPGMLRYQLWSSPASYKSWLGGCAGTSGALLRHAVTWRMTWLSGC